MSALAQEEFPSALNARLRSGCERIFSVPQGYRVEVLLPPVAPHYPKGLLVLAPLAQEVGEAQHLEGAFDPVPILDRLDALAESIDRHRKFSREVLATLGFGD